MRKSWIEFRHNCLLFVANLICMHCISISISINCISCLGRVYVIEHCCFIQCIKKHDLYRFGQFWSIILKSRSLIAPNGQQTFINSIKSYIFITLNGLFNGCSIRLHWAFLGCKFCFQHGSQLRHECKQFFWWKCTYAHTTHTVNYQIIINVW